MCDSRGGFIAALSYAFVIGAVVLYVLSLTTQGDDRVYLAAPALGSSAARTESRDPEYLVRPEAPPVGVNIVKPVHQRAPATDAEAAEWLSAEEMVNVEPGTAVRRVKGEAPAYAVFVEVINGPKEGLRGWVWQDTLRHEWP